MIKIIRGNCPPILAGGGDIDNQVCHKEVVETLHTRQHGKCCYCEKKIAKEGHEQAIEHFHPQAPTQFPQLKNEWTNLLHACANCNGKKGNKFPVDPHDSSPLFIDPSNPSIDPEDHFDFEVNDEDINFGRIKAKNNSDQEETTIKELGLDLVDRRRDRYSIYNALYNAYVEILLANDQFTKDQKVRAFEAMLGANNPYAAFARAFARKKNLDSRFNVRILQGAEVAA